MSEIGTLSAWLPLLVPARWPLGPQCAISRDKAITTLANVTLTPSPSDGGVAPDLPRVYQLNNDQLKKFLPGTLLLTNGGETRYVPVEDPVREQRSTRADTNFEWSPLAAPGRKEAGAAQFSIQRRRQKKHFKQQFWESAPSREAKAGSQNSCAIKGATRSRSSSPLRPATHASSSI